MLLANQVLVILKKGVFKQNGNILKYNYILYVTLYKVNISINTIKYL